MSEPPEPRPYTKRSRVTRGRKVQVSLVDIELSRAAKAGDHVTLDLANNTRWIDPRDHRQRRRQL